MSLATRLIPKPRSVSKATRARLKAASLFRPETPEQFEPRIVLSGVTLLPAGTGELTDASFATLEVTPTFTATKPVLSADGNSIVTNFTNTCALPITVGVAVYEDQSSSPPITLATEVLVNVQYVVVPAEVGGVPGTATSTVAALPCIQLDEFINKVGTDVVSNVVTTFTSFDQIPSSNAAPPVDAGYNVTNFNKANQVDNTHASASNPNPTGANLLGTLVAYAQTSGLNGSSTTQPTLWDSRVLILPLRRAFRA